LDLQFSAKEQAMFAASTYSIIGNLGIDELGQYLLLWQQLEHITLSDQLSWSISPPIVAAYVV
jgi:hypothetical protein